MPNARTGLEGEGRKRQRNSLACKRCRQRKIKCDGDDGTGCQACRNAHGVEQCDYLRVNSNSVEYKPYFASGSTGLWDHAPSEDDSLFHTPSTSHTHGLSSFTSNLSQTQWSATMPKSLSNIDGASSSSQSSTGTIPFNPAFFGGGFEHVSPIQGDRHTGMGIAQSQPSWYGSIEDLDFGPQYWAPSTRQNASFPPSGSEYNTLPADSDSASTFANVDISPKTRPLSRIGALNSYHAGDPQPRSRHQYPQSNALAFADIDYDDHDDYSQSQRRSKRPSIQSSNPYAESLRGSQVSMTPDYMRTPRASFDAVSTLPTHMTTSYDRPSILDNRTITPKPPSRSSQGGTSSIYQLQQRKAREDAYTTESNRVGRPAYRHIRPLS